jgi:hypothetical protein
MKKNIMLFTLMATAAVTSPVHYAMGAHATKQNNGLERAKAIFKSDKFINEVVAIKFLNKTYLVRLINNPQGKALKVGFLTIESRYIMAPQNSLPDALIEKLKSFTLGGMTYLDASINGKKPFDLLATAK